MSRDPVFVSALAGVIAIAILLMPGTAWAAQNDGCTVAGDTASCNDVPADGISYSHPTTTINVGDGDAGVTAVKPSTSGIVLRQTDGSPSTTQDLQFKIIKDYVVSGSGSTAVKWDVVGRTHNGVDEPVRVDGKYIRHRLVDGKDEFKINDEGVVLTGKKLAEELAKSDVHAGTSFTAGLTVNNGISGGAGASFETSGASGIVVESIGGGGGSGSCGSILLYTWCSDGSTGGDASSIAVNSNGAITVDGTGYGISATSRGGNGGKGGGWVGLVSDSGEGGNGGKGGAITVGLGAQSVIITDGDAGHGVYVSSRGGDGGAAGSSSGAVALGNTGGNGGDAGAVGASNLGAITTKGEKAYGIYAESVGAGAGSGSDVGGLVAIGGGGGGQSHGAAVTIDNAGTIQTEGLGSYGIFAQSIGGGGGDGGTAGGLFAVGGTGGSGGNSGIVTVTHSGSVDTLEEGAIAILAQSIGGGGGNGGGAIAAGPSLSIGVGGNGGLGGNGANVIVDMQVANVADPASIKTGGDRAHGIQAQSVGGGGGNGGLAIAATPAGGSTLSAAIALGGKGGSAGTGADVEVDAAGSIETGGEVAHGIFAQSVGGGGGSGGGAVAASTGSPISFNLAMGGEGSGGGAAGRVDVATAAQTSIVTTGAGSIGILAQSVGGGGGNGGFAAAGGLAPITLSFGLGGDGAGGGAGDKVNVDNKGAITTTGANAIGIFAQSVGGGGGNGGFSVGASLGVVAITATLGGDGAGGGKGDDVTVANAGAISTTGDLAYGILAQSVGGGGGNGGFAVAVSAAASPDPTIPSVAASISVGGSGGTASNGGTVRVANTGSIETRGAATHGIYAQSVGGGGGSGGFAASGVLTLAPNPQTAGAGITVAVGGAGGGGGNGGTVTVGRDANNFGLAGSLIKTHGDYANAIFAQSVGGGGGHGGMAIAVNLGKGAPGSQQLNIGVSVGGSGGDGGDGGVVDVYTQQVLRTLGDNASAIVAQSVGGGGGVGGSAITGMLQIVDTTDENSQAIGVAVAIGGTGGEGGIGKAVTVENRGEIVTGEVVKVDDIPQYDEDGTLRVAGASSHGIFAQSVGGSGGVGGNANSINMILGKGCGDVCPPESRTNVSLRVSVGGSGGLAGDGGAVTVTNAGTITTLGAVANGILAQSVGGGGGIGGNGILGSNGLIPIPVDFIANVTMGKTKKYSDLGVAVGGNGGGSGSGGIVKVINEAGITTYGSNSTAIVAQSVGGGGGIGGVGTIGATGTVGVGGKGTSGGNGGKVTVSQVGDITTYGSAAYGIFAESVGGGGGLAGNVDRLFAKAVGPVPALNVGMGLALGQGGGAGGDGGDVTVTVDGDITTHGDSAVGIFAHSVGGGGGTLGELGNNVEVLDNLSWHIGSNGDIGDGGNVTVEVDGAIRTSGNNATGIFAQSAGGVANADDEKGIARDVKVTVAGIVETAALLSDEDGTADDPPRGLGAIGIVAHSAGGAGNGNITIRLEQEGKVLGGRSDSRYTAAGIEIIDGLNNVVTNYGMISTADGVELGYAILAYGSNPTGLASNGAANDPALVATAGREQAGGIETIENFGTITGSVDLGEGLNSFLNYFGATFNTGTVAKLGAGNTLANDGVLSPGGDGRVMTTDVTGDIAQGIAGRIKVDLDLSKSGADGAADPAGSADRLNATGEVTLDGTLSVALLNAGQATTGTHSAILVNSATANGMTDDGIALDTSPSVILNYWLTTSPEQLILNYSVDFSPEGLVGNQVSVGDYLGAIQAMGGALELEPLINGLVYLPDMQSYAEALDQLSPEPYVSNQMAAFLATLEFQNQLMSCRVPSGAFRFSAEGECAWATIEARYRSFESVDGHLASQQMMGGLAAGGQVALNDSARFGLGASYAQMNSTTESSGASGDVVQAGGVLKLQSEGTTLALSASAGYGALDVTRSVTIPNGPSYVLTGRQEVAFVGAHARLSQTFEGESGYIRPSIDVGVTELFELGFTESGGPVALVVDPQQNLYVTATPAIEIGGEIALGPDVVFRPFVRGGAEFRLYGGGSTVTSGFVAAPASAGNLEVAGRLDPYLLDFSAGFDIVADNGVAAKVTGTAQMGASQLAYGANVKFSAPF